MAHSANGSSAFERQLTSAWRTVRKRLPSGFAESVRVPAKRLLRKVGLISR
jgi:hypothetical protein